MPEGFGGQPPEGFEGQPPEGMPEGLEGQFPGFVRGSEASASPGGVISATFSLSRQSFYFIGVQDAE
jgi:hypothetical protein